MPSHPLFERALSRATSTPTRPSTPPKPSTRDLTRRFLALLLTLSRPPNPSHPKTLSALDSLLARARPLGPTPSLLLLRGLSLLKKLTRSRSLLLHLKRRAQIPSLFLFSAALQCTLRRGTTRDVEAFFADLDPNVTVSDFVVCLCRRSGSPSEVERVYSRISSDGRRLSGEAYAGLIGASSELGRVVLNEMEERGIEVDGLSYFAAFRGFCRDGNVFEADSVLRDWSRRRRGEVGDLGACVYGEFLYGLCKSGKFREARKLFDKMTTGDFDRQAAEKPSGLLKARRRVIFQLAYPGVVHEEIAFKAYFRSLCSIGKVGEAEKLLSVTKSKDTCVYDSYVKALFRASRIDDALRFFGSKRNKELVSSIIFGLCENGKVDDGHRLLDETITEGFVPTARVLNCIIKSYWENGREEKAREMFRRMSSESCSDYRTKPDSETYSVMIGKFLEKGEVDIGVSLLDEMRAKNLKAGVDLYCDIVRGLYKCGRVEEGEKRMNAMIENGILVSYESWESLYDSVIMEGDREIGELWKEIEANCKAREDEKRRLKRK